MKKLWFGLLVSVPISVCAVESQDTAVTVDPTSGQTIQPIYDGIKTDTTSASIDFTLQEKFISIGVGESKQLSVLTDNAKGLAWGPSFFDKNLKIFVDQDGVVTALNEGNAMVICQSQSETQRCEVTVGTAVCDVKSKTISLAPHAKDESLVSGLNVNLKDNKIAVSGAYYGNSAFPSELDYYVYKNCVFVDIDINYDDSASVDPFCLQPLELVIDNCDSPYYYVYLCGVKMETIQESENVIKYTVGRNEGGLTSVIKTEDGKKELDDRIFDIKGRQLSNKPANGIYIRNGRIYYNK